MSACNSNKYKGSDSMPSQYQSMINNTKRFCNISTKSFSINDFGRLNLPYKLQGSYSLSLTIDNVKETIGLDCLRDNKGFVYSVHRFTNNDNQPGYCFISYDSVRVIDSWFVVKIPDKSKFKVIKSNKTTLSDIKLLDPATILFDGDEPQSYHRFSDGTAIEIRYTKNGDTYTVKDYGFVEDPITIVKYLLPVDMQLIS